MVYHNGNGRHDSKNDNKSYCKNGGFSEKNGTKKDGFLSSAKEIFILLLIVFLIRTFGFGLYQVPTGSMETTMLVGERFFADKFTILFSKVNRGDIIAFNDPLFNYSKNTFVRLFQEYVWGPSNWTKRLIGVPGDEIKGVIEDGKPVLYINGVKSNEPYINKYPLIYVWKSGGPTPKSYDPRLSYDNQPFYRINKEHVFINRIYATQDNQPLIFYPNRKINEAVIEVPGTPLAKPGNKKISGENYWNNGDEFSIKLGENQYWVMGDNRLGSHDSRFFGPIDGRLIHGRIMFRIWSVDSDADWWILDFIKHPIDFIKRIRLNRFFQTVK